MTNGPFFTVSSHGKDVIATHAKNIKWKIFHTHCDQGRIAYDSKGDAHPLSECDFNDVRFIGGEWRIQNKFEHEIINVRDKQFVLGKKLDICEKNQFEYFDAYMVAYNCYGPFISANSDFIVGRFPGTKNTVWAYGATIPAVRSFLAIALFDQYSDLIFAQENITPAR